MNKHSIRIAWFATLLLVLAFLPAWAKTAQTDIGATAVAQNFAPGSGASATLLPNGQLLLVGGQDSHGKIQNAAAIQDPAGGPVTPLAGMHHARVYYSATVLPDGTVLILGGIGADGRVVAEAESFDPQTRIFSVVSSAPSPRAFHTATLLTDGRLLVAGGVSAQNKLLRAVELWDPRHPTAPSPKIELQQARRNHTATLLADGRVLFSAGKDEHGNAIGGAEVFDPAAQNTSVADNPGALLATLAGMTEARATSPEDQAVGVPVDALISVRFSRAVEMASISQETVQLQGPQGAIAARIVAAEGGMLAFVTPHSTLQPGTTYSVSLSGAVDTANGPVAHAQFSFTTAGVPPQDAQDNDDERWHPTPDWRSDRGESDVQKLPSLKAPDGVTALAGRVLRMNGKPLEHVTLTIGKRHVETDDTGRFLLTDVPAGHQVLEIDGTTANRPGKTYGYYEFGAELHDKKTTTLSFTIWMPVLDMAHAVNIPSPTTKETVISNPTVPGLELHLPPGTVIYDRDHKIVKQVSITPIPLDRTPFPLPYVQVPLFFTIQPGGAYIEVHGSWAAKGGRLFYPNSGQLAPGAVFAFWNYNADHDGWYQYGLGHVNAQGTQIVPDAGVEVYEFSGAMVGNGSAGPGTGNEVQVDDGDPVNLSNGLFTYRKTDLSLPDVIPLTLTRTYRQNDSGNRAFGIATSHPYEMFLGGDGRLIPNTPYVDLFLPDGTRIHFVQSPDPNTYMHYSSASSWYGASISHVGNAYGKNLPGYWQLRTKDGTYYSFPQSENLISASCQALVGITDRHGNQVLLNRAPQVMYNGTPYCDLMSITSPNGRSISFQYDGGHHIISATDNGGRAVHYSYDGNGRLISVIDVNGGETDYVYDDQAQMLTIEDPRHIVYLQNEYDNAGNISKQTQADGGVYQFNWVQASFLQRPKFNAGGCSACLGDPIQFRLCTICYDTFDPIMLSADVTDPNGNTRHVEFDPTTGNTLLDIRNRYTPQQQQFSYTYYSDNLLKSATDSLGHTTTFDSYDAYGNPTSVTRMANTPAAATTKIDFGAAFANLLQVVDPVGGRTSFNYNEKGDMIWAADAMGHTTTMSYDSEGRPLTITDPMRNPPMQFTYDGADLATTTDALGRTATQFYDNVGRVIQSISPSGEKVQYAYNNFNQVTQVTDPIGGVTSFTYDGNGNLLTVQDARHQDTTVQASYVYDAMDRVQSRTDQLGRQQFYSYDKNGNLISFTDRNSKLTTFAYDGFNRRTFAGFGTVGNPPTYESTINYTYDVAGRVTQIVDSASGTIGYSYDDISRTATETIGTRSVTAAVDAIGRVTSMALTGQPQVTYQYDSANRLLQIQKGESTVSFGYNDDNRRTSMTLPNSIVVTYTYNQGSQLTAITYQHGLSTIGTLNYAYDVGGRRTQVTGSLARSGLPPALTAATYDDANQIASWNGVPFAYDNAGHLTNDGSNTYLWNARGQLAGMAGPVNAAFSYDAIGRRTGKLVGSQNTGFTYNGETSSQELDANSNVTANIWNGGTSFFQRTDINATVVPIADALGSVLALADPSGNLATQYTYDPYGATSVLGAFSRNAYQYIGQENDVLTGLYYLHARYYSPTLMRFISEDPLGYAGGDMNFYAYGWKSPTNLRDPNGTNPLMACVIGGLVVMDAKGVWTLLHGRKVTLTSLGQDFASGCEFNVVAEIIGFNWLMGKAIGVVLSPVLDVISDVAGRVLTEELEAAAEAACGGCLPAGTQIHTRRGLVPIERIKKGDEVLSRNRLSGKLEYQRVSGVIRPHLDKTLEISVIGEEQPLQSTPTHQFFVKHASEMTGGWAEASVIKVGDAILTKDDTWSTVTKVSDTKKETTVYNFEVESDHDYFAGERGFLVHNAACLLDGNALIRALDYGELPAIDAALAGDVPVVSVESAGDYLSKGSVDTLDNFLQARGGYVTNDATVAEVQAVQAQARALGRSVSAGDANIAAAALRDGLDVLTQDKQLFRFLQAIGETPRTW
jgi:RHS repeat-associated protein